ncbi:hypothetical protein QBC36DRAFT_297446 [Triangularia setosa]|uniref:Polyketide synthase n=1 Tax=Triangularia setosa TaxID=2587417 RepID=A0AAN6WF82_9PEZI|nr:hypothetical protein QBC36DRAFT_297446 [Podospora setosa]
MDSTTSTPAGNEPIAIVGSGCRFPGGATSPSKLWDLLREPRDVLCEIPPSRWDTAGFYHQDSQFPGHANVKHSYLLQDDVSKFDAQFFNITAAEAIAMDPQQRVLLETVYEGLEGAGLTIEGLKGSNTGVYVGVMYVDYESLQFRDLQHVPTYLAIGTARSIVSNRISYFFDWHGPSLTVDTACSSSLVAVHQAVQALRSGDVRVAVAAGSNLLLGPEPYIHESKLKMLSPDGRSRMWDQGANGYARGDGVAAVVLKTLSAALADGDHIEAIIRETGVNQDGRSRGITMPSATAQTALIRATYAKAGLNPDSEADRCQYFEAHGTGTPAGDPVEAEAVHTAFFGNGATKAEEERLLVGSIKTIIGHTESTAGIAGILKVVQAMKHGYVPPNMLLEKLNPDVLPFYSHLQIPQELMPWPKVALGQRRRASVNSFGFGGTNAHIILEGFEAPNDDNTDGQSSPLQVAPFLFSAQSKQSLLAGLAAHAEYLEQHPNVSAADLAWSLRSRRSRLPLRLALPASTIEALRSSLKGILGNSNFQLESKAAGTSTKEARLLGIFTGQGAQWARMGAELVETSEHAASLLASMDEALAQLPEADRPPWTLREQLLAEAKSSQVGSAAVAQPLCTAVQVVLVELLRLCGIGFAAVVGHSSGEIGAAFAAGALSAVDAIRIAYYRGLHSRLAGGADGVKGAMLAVGTSLEDAEGLCNDEYFAGRAKVAACNSASSITISGDEDAIDEMVDIFEDENKFVRRLRVDKAYHSHHMVPCSQPYLDSMSPFTAPATRSASGCVWVSSVRPDEPLEEGASVDASYWVDNLLSPVLFKQAVEKAMELGPFDAAIEVGPHPALKGPVLDTLRDHKVEIPYTGLLQRNTDAVESVSAALGYVWTHVDNLDIDVDRYEACMGGPTSHRFLPDLPTYQWNHNQGYWHESNLSRCLRTRSQPVHQLLGDLQPQSSAHQVTWKAILRPQDLPWVHHHRIQGQTVFPAAAYAATAFETIPFLANGSPVQMMQIQDLFIHQALVFGNDDQESGIEVRSVVSNIRREDGAGSILAHFTYEAITGPDQNFQLVASCEISVNVGEPSRDTLPATPRLEPYMVDVDTELAYSSLSGVGYGYTGPFKALSGLKRKLGKASGSLALTQPEPDQEELIIHPAVLDAAFHSIILTFSYPEDGRLWSLHLPTRIDRIRVNPSLCGRNWGDATEVSFVASMGNDADESRETSGFQGDVDIHDPTGEYTAVQVEGLHVVPFTPASAADDQQQFYATDWVPSEPNSDIPGTYEASVEDKEMATILERGSLFYLGQLEQQIPKDHPGRSDTYNAAYLNFASHTLRLVQQGRHRYAKKEWLNDTLEDILSLSAPFSDQPEIKAMHVVGEQMPKAIQGETTMLEHLMNNGLLADYYAQARSITRGTDLLADTVVQIARRYPRAKILEVGAGTGGATREILKRIGDNFSSYAFTDISAAFFDKAEEEFASFEGAMTYSVLDLEQEVKIQGFEEHSYDVVVASFVLHATLSIEQTVRRVRSLLKPGGYLVLFEVTNTDIIRGTALFGCLPGWWQGMEEGRILGACVSESTWDSILRKTGFSGVDTMTPVKDAMALPNSVMVSQALSEWVELIREPLMASSPSLFSGQSIIKHLFIIGGSTLRVSRLAEDVRKLIHAFCDEITRVKSIEELDSTGAEIGPDATVVVLEDLDHPVFKDITPSRWNGLKSLFGSQKAIAWVTQDRMTDNPFGNMAVGFARSALWEIPEIRYQFIDFQDAYRIDARALAEAVLRFQMAGSVQEQSQRNTLWSVEQEIVIDVDGRQLVPRMRAVSDANDRYNSSRRAITKDVNPQESSIAYEAKGGQYALVQRSTRVGAPVGFEGEARTLTLNLSLSSLRAIKTAGFDAFLVLGACTKTGNQYLGLCDSVTSLVEMPQDRLIPCSVSTESAALFLTIVAAQLVLPAITSSLREGDTLIVHNAPASVAKVLSQHSQSSDIKTIYTTSSKAVAEKLGWSYVGRYMRQSEKRTLLPQQVSRCVDFTTGEGVSMVSSCLPSGVAIVDGTAWFPAEGRPMRASETEMISELLQAAQDSALSTLETSCLQDQPGISHVNIQHLGGNAAESYDALAIVDWNASSVSVAVQPATVQFKANRTYWLVGLSGDLGISIADWMIKNGAKYLVITSRNPKVDERWLRSAKTKGAVVSVMACDLTSYDDLAKTHGQIRQELPPVAGVYQGAMILLDMALRDMELDDFSRVLRPKVEGSLNLDRVLGDEPLDFFIFFSSVATVAGNPGQAGYTTANLFMSGMAQQRRKRGLPASVVELGLIMGTGYITREKGNVLTRPSFERGLLTISEYDVHQTLAEAVRYGHPESGADWQISIGLRQMAADAPNRPQWYSYPQFSCLTIKAAAGETNATNTQAGPSIKEKLENAATTDDVQKIISESFIAEMRKMLHLSDDYAITPSVRTDELGLDSLVAVRIRSWFLNNFQVNIPALRILKGAALQELIDYAVEEIPAEVAPRLSASVSEETASASGASSALDSSSQKSAHTPPTTAPESETSSAVNGDHGSKEERASLVPQEVEIERFGHLSYTQSVFLFVHELLPDKTTLNNTVMLHLSGELRIPDLSRAVRSLGERHETLRSCIFNRDGQPSQGVLKSPTFSLEHKRIHTKEDLFNEYAALRGHVFDLSRGQTSRTILLSYSSREHFLLMSSHHIFFDRASNDAVMGDLERLYHNYPLDPNPLQYLDYSEDQLRQYSAGEWDNAIDFWRSEFTTIPDPLPLHRSQISERQPLERYASRIPDFRIDSQLSGKIRQVARQHRVTPFHFHLAAFKALLHRFLGVTDVCVGIADSCRRDEHMRTGIGPFLNMLPLRMAARGDQAFSEALEEAREKSFTVLANSIPLEVILNELRVSRQATHTPLAQAFMNYAENDLEDGQSFLGCRMKMMKQEMAELPYDITFTVINNTTGDTRILLNVQESLYTESDAQILQHGYQDILREFANTPNKEIGDSWQFRPDVLQKALVLGRGPNFDSTWPETLIHRFEELVPSVAQRTAVTDSDGGSLTYEQLASRVHAVALELLRKGVEPGAKVAVFQQPSILWIASLLAIMKIGAVYVPLDANTPVARLSLIVCDSQPAVILTHGPTADEAEKLETRQPTPLIDVSACLSVSSPKEDEVVAATLAKSDAPAIILYTSGSTGNPKGVVLSHSGLKHEFDHCAATYKLSVDDVVLQQSAWSFDLSVTQIFLALGVGARLHTVSHLMRSDSRAMVEVIQSEGVTVTYATPTEYKSWLRRENQELLVRLSSWRLALVAGEPVTEPLLQLFREANRPGLRLFNVYGPTETTCGSTKTELSYQTPGFYQGTIPVGSASANECFYILDERQNLQPVGGVGEIAIGGVGVAMGYLNLDERTRASFLPDPFAGPEDSKNGRWKTMYRTGDVGYLQPDGSLVLKGRVGDDTEIKLNGVRIDLRDIEGTVLRASGGVLADAVATLRTTAEEGVKFIVVHVVFSAEGLAEDESRRYLQTVLAELPLPRTMLPSALVPIDSLPRTVAGKVDRRAIGALPISRGLSHSVVEQAGTMNNFGSSGAALSKNEQTLRGFWEAVIPEELSELHQIDADSDFFTVGGNSLLLIELQGRIRAALDISIPLPKLFQATSLRSMAQLLPNIGDDDHESSDDVRMIIDWEAETAVTSADLATTTPPDEHNVVLTPPRTVVLTGATGFLGQYLSRCLADHPHIQKIICIAVRNPHDPSRQALFSNLLSNPKIEFHTGDLSHPLLGLSPSTASLIFSAADAVIHNGADVSHLKTYPSLRLANLVSTKELARLCAPRNIPLHYVSTTGVAMYTPFDSLAEVSVRDHKPSVDGQLPGYVASKWASEVYLENIHLATGLPVYIHRASSIIRPEGDRTGENPAADVLQNMLDYSLRMCALPAAPGLRGFVDLVRPETVADKVVDVVMEARSGSEQKEGVGYFHESGDLELDVREIGEYLVGQAGPGKNVEMLELEDWIGRAEREGLSSAMAAVFRSSLGSGEAMNLPRLLRR